MNILNGDIIDGWNLKRNGKWNKKETKFIRYILKLSYKSKVIYIRGNHDDFLDKITPLKIGNLTIRDQYTHYSNNKKYLVVHGDIFDSITKNFKWIAKIGDIGYLFLLWLNRLNNKIRKKKGKEYFSLSKYVKQKVKIATNYIQGYEKEMVEYCKSKNYDGIICGHIHYPEIRKIKGIEYLNSGDLVESCSVLVETTKNKWKIIYI
jgi:UDP-2,3-diacylglucosamine pyrophosphatase LpxH